ncbi:MAG: TRAP transporter small permease [Deltaproteobacteria bacterium]|nr:TRAP transporter small permease [Deltaproteobacteria bacterium]
MDTKLRVLCDWLEKWELRLAQVLVSALILIVFGQVISRYILHMEMLWSQEMSLFCFVWSSFLGAAIAVRRKTHFVFDFLPANMPLAQIASYAGMLIMATLFLLEGSFNCLAEWRRFSEPSGYRFTWFVLPIPLMGASMLLFLFEGIRKDWTGRRRREERV